MSARYPTWRDVLTEFIPRIRAAEARTPEAIAIRAELIEAAAALGMPIDRVQELIFLAIMCNNPNGDRFIWEQTGARVGAMRSGATP